MATYARHWKVRPYMLRMTAWRPRSRRPLLMHTLVSTGDRFDPVLAQSLPSATRKVYEAARRVCSVAELSAHSGLSIGVTRVLVTDLLKTDELVIHDSRTSPEVRPAKDIHLLERLRAGLLKLT